MLHFMGILALFLTLFIGCGGQKCCASKDNVSNVQKETLGDTISSDKPVATITSGREICKLGDTITFDGRQSSDVDGYVENYTWTDGDTLITSTSVVTLNCDVEGKKNICLSVKDDQNNSSNQICQTYTVSKETKIPPHAAISVVPSSCIVGETFLVKGDQSSDRDGEISSYVWSFEGERSSKQNPLFTCAKEGDQTLCLQVQDNEGLTDRNCSTIIGQTTPNHKPVADLSLSKKRCILGEVVNLDASKSTDSDGFISEYIWTPDTLSGAQDHYDCTKEGSHEVCVVVKDDQGRKSEPVCKTIYVSKHTNTLPVAKIVNVPQTCTVGDIITADGTTSSDSDGRITAYNWSEDDNQNISKLAKPLFHCDYEGSKKVCLQVMDNDGAYSANVACKDIQIQAKPQPAPQTIPPKAVMSVGDPTLDANNKIDGFWFDCSKSYDQDRIDSDHNSANDAKVLKATWNIYKTNDGVKAPLHTRDICRKWVGTPDKLDFMEVTLIVTDDDGESASVTQVYDWNGHDLIQR